MEETTRRGERLTGCLSCNWRKALDRSYARTTWLRCMSCDRLKRRRKCSGPSLVELSEGRPPNRFHTGDIPVTPENSNSLISLGGVELTTAKEILGP